MECVRQDEGNGGKLWDAMRSLESCGKRRKAVCTFLHTKGDGITANFRRQRGGIPPHHPLNPKSRIRPAQKAA